MTDEPTPEVSAMQAAAAAMVEAGQKMQAAFAPPEPTPAPEPEPTPAPQDAPEPEPSAPPREDHSQAL
jgi:hypothetical protein